jgi:hypothetical protein
VPVKTTYTAIVKNPPSSIGAGCERREDITVTVIPKPVVDFTAIQPLACGTSSGSIEIDITAPDNSFSYFVTSPSFNASDIQKATGTYLLPNLPSGPYSLVVYDEVSGCRNTEIVTLHHSLFQQLET